MSELSVNDHLEGILSDFEALKRSFDIDDEEDLSTFPSPVGSPLPPASPRFFLNDSRTGVTQSLSQNPLRSPSVDRSLRPRALVTSLSFNKGNTTPHPQQIRRTSFHSRFSPNGFSSAFGGGSDNDSLHSSTSSLEFSAGGARLLAYPGQRSPDDYPLSQLHNLDGNFNQRKYSPVLEPRDMSSRSPLNSQSLNGDMGGAVGGNGGRLSPGFKVANANANWNGRFRSASSFGEEHPTLNSPRPGTSSGQKRPPQLNKFPLDLDHIMSAPCHLHEASPRADAPLTSPSWGPVSSSNSLSSLDGSDAPLCVPLTPQGPQCVLRVSPCPLPLSPPQTPQLQVLSGPLVGQLEGSLVRDELSDSVGSILQRIASFSQTSFHSGGDGTAQGLRRAGHLRESDTVVERDILMADTEVPHPTAHGSTSNDCTDTGQDDSRLTQDLNRGATHSNGEATNSNGGITHSNVEVTQSNGEVTQSNGEVTQSNGEVTHSSREVTYSNSREEDSTQGHPQEHPLEHSEAEARPLTPGSGSRCNGEMRPGCPSADSSMSFLSGADLFGYVGIEAVLDQMRRKTMRAGFEFNIMVVGQSGLGKSTLVNTLFKSRVSRKSSSGVHQEKIPKTVSIHQVSHMIEEKGVKMKLTVVDTPGFGDHINNNHCWEPIVSYVNEQYERYLREELNVTRKRHIPDTRVHCCVYFLPPTGHRLRPIDVEFMRRLGSIVSIVPVIAKADTLTLDERLDFKHRIRQDLAANGILVYPQKQYDEDPEEHILNSSIRETIPFAVVGTDREHQVNGHKVLGRKTKWGIIEVENIAHCEFSQLRDLLIRSHLQDLKDVTQSVLYETYRVQRLNQANVDLSWLALPPTTSPFLSDAESQL